ncbi:hypothetical protein [Enterobacter cloacae]|uniref:hypothetical protein n=1 Tax=Enterobacter cloacae TaxID=550 RepID=UPI0034CFEDC5
MSELEKIACARKEESLYQLFSQVSPEIFREFLLEREVRKLCLSCGMNKLYIPTRERGDGKGSYVWYQAINSAFDITPDNAEYLTVCTHCGYISRYHSMIVFDWLTKSQKKEEGDG